MSEWDKMLFACAMTVYGIFYLLRKLHAVRLLLRDMKKKMLQRLTYSNDFFCKLTGGGLLDRKPTDYRCSRGYLKGANSSRLGENFI